MQRRELLSSLDIGKSVAEFDDALERYFVETSTFRALLDNKADIIAGDKGTWKTAIYKILQRKYASLESLRKVEVVPAFNPIGNSVFQKLVQDEVLEEGEYVKLWKTYILSLIGNWLLGVWSGSYTKSMQDLDILLVGLELRTENHTPHNILAKLMSKLGGFLNWRSAELTVAVNEAGFPTFTPKIEFKEENNDAKPNIVLSIEAALGLLNRCTAEADITIWVAIDRLDEAFQGFPAVEIPALRALLRAYLGLLEFDRLRLKLFLRRDLFRRVTAGGFVNLTHVNARKLELIWDEEDLLSLLCRRIRDNEVITSALALSDMSDKAIFERLFPKQVDVGKRKPLTLTWIMRRIRDGQDVKPPRNLIDLIQMAQQAQLRREEREDRALNDEPLIEPDSLRRGLSQLSRQRVSDTLLAEAGPYREIIEKFREGKRSTTLNLSRASWVCKSKQ